MKMTIHFTLIISVFFFLQNCAPKQSKKEENEFKTARKTPTLSSESITIDLTQLKEDHLLPPEVLVTIKKDHFFRTEKSYLAYRFKDILQPYLEQLEINENSDALVTFFCTDGYSPTQKVSEIMEKESYLAYKDRSIPLETQNWPESIEQKFLPFYLVWKDVPYEDHKYQWPYGLYEIRIEIVEKAYAQIFPSNEPNAIAGFEIYSRNCAKCHSINKIGGNLGPELNYPKNILTYWDPENIWEFIQNPKSFRYNSKMPAQSHLSRKEFNEILVYLEFVQGISPQETAKL